MGLFFHLTILSALGMLHDRITPVPTNPECGEGTRYSPPPTHTAQSNLECPFPRSSFPTLALPAHLNSLMAESRRSSSAGSAEAPPASHWGPALSVPSEDSAERRVIWGQRPRREEKSKERRALSRAPGGCPSPSDGRPQGPAALRRTRARREVPSKSAAPNLHLRSIPWKGDPFVAGVGEGRPLFSASFLLSRLPHCTHEGQRHPPGKRLTQRPPGRGFRGWLTGCFQGARLSPPFLCTQSLAAV